MLMIGSWLIPAVTVFVIFSFAIRESAVCFVAPASRDDHLVEIISEFVKCRNRYGGHEILFFKINDRSFKSRKIIKLNIIENC